MREILFRGKRNYNGKWVEGSLLVWPDGSAEMCYPNPENGDELLKVIVWSETVGQFTGLTDKNGKKIFEGDMFYSDEMTAVIIFKDGSFRLEWHGLCGAWTEGGFDECGGGYGIIECEPIDWVYIHDMEIIGNIHDNPELLEGNQ